MTVERARVAVIGASGIGKHHAKWWHLEGADVCAVAGTSEASAARAAEGLRALFPYAGRAYADLDELLERERPDIVDVCSPPHCHADHVRRAVDAGAHVFCEKPFVHRAGAPREDLMAEAEDLVRRAASKGVRLGLCLQYSEGARMFQEMRGARSDVAPVSAFSGRLEVPARGRQGDPERIWADLGPHPLSALQMLCPGGDIEEASLETTFEGYEASARFVVKDKAGCAVSCEIVTRNIPDPPRHVREFRVNGYPFRIDGVNDEHGVYCAVIHTPDGERRAPDLMRQAIRAFLDGRPTVGPEEALRNTDWLLRISERALPRR